jgi:sugar phosphate isomerase/epimerase
MYSDDVWGRSGPQAVINITERAKTKRLAMVGEIKRALEIAEQVPFRYLIQHLGVTGEEFDEWKVEAAFSALEEITLFAQQRGVEVLIENTPNGMASAERILTFIELTHMDLNVCLDVGHAHMNESIETAFKLLRNRIRSTHIHDNDGVEDQHLFPLRNSGGSIDWAHTMGLLRSAPVQYPLVLELREVDGMEQPIRAAKSVLDELEALTAHES